MEKPIIFSTEMVQAILEGSKTQTRRIIKQKYENATIEWFTNKYGTRLVYRQNNVPEPVKNPNGTTSHKLIAMEEIKKPYEVGDVLWVRETWCKIPNLRAFKVQTIYKADYKSVDFDEIKKLFPKAIKWKPSIHMPRSAARLFLKVVNIRAERLQDITEDGAKAEGMSYPIVDVGNNILENGYRLRFMDLWNSLYNNWDENPWVWVIEFEKL